MNKLVPDARSNRKHPALIVLRMRSREIPAQWRKSTGAGAQAWLYKRISAGCGPPEFPVIREECARIVYTSTSARLDTIGKAVYTRYRMDESAKTWACTADKII